MPAPSNNNEFLELIRKSGVVEEAKQTAYVKQLRDANQLPPEPSKLAGLMVRDGLLTFFQAEQFLLGKWKRFTIGKYKVLERLGSGGMGQVFLCEHKLMRRRVAVKVLPTAKAEDASSLERFYREARAVAALDHPNIVRAYDIDQDDNLHFLVMEYVDGASMQDIIKRVGPLDPVRVCHYIAQASIGLQHASESGLIHRDIKPGNLLVDRTGVVKILDMGLARFFNDEDDNITKRHDESVLGTADYLAPEQAIDSHGVDIRADIYSLGATMYFLLTGSPPFAEGTVAQKLIWHQTRQPKPVRQLRPEVPEELVKVVSTMMAKDPAQRYQHPLDVAHALAPWTQQPIAPPSEAEMPQLCLAAQGAPATTATTPVSGTRPVPSRSAARPVSQASLYLPPVAPPGSSGYVAALPPGPANGQGRNPPTPAPMPVPAAVNGPVRVPEEPPAFWETLTDARPTPVSAPAAPKSKRLSHKAGPPPWVYGAAGGGALMLLLIAALAARALLVSAPGPQGPPPTTVVEYVVNPAAASQPGTYVSINAALAGFATTKGGSLKITVTGNTAEQIHIDGKKMAGLRGLLIEGDGKATLSPPPNVPTGGEQVLISASNLERLERFELRGLHFDGENRVPILVRVMGQCPGLVLADLHLTSFRQSAVKFVNSEGEEGRPAVVTGCRCVGGPGMAGSKAPDAGILLVARGNVADPRPATRNVRVENCRVEGPIAVGVKSEGSLQSVEVSQNRFWRCTTAGVALQKPAGKDKAFWFDVTLRSNTFVECGSGVAWDAPVGQNQVPVRLTVDKNLFALTKQLLAPTVTSAVGKPAWADFGANGAAASSEHTSISLGATPLTYALPTTDPAKPDFLTYPPDAPPAQPPGPFGFVRP
jgi:serine/threonine protein kinase